VFPFPLPPINATSGTPQWTGNGFAIGDSIRPVLSYALEDSGWTDELTDFHESQAGEHHYIDIASRKIALSRLRKYLTNPQPVIMDIGCSSGFMVRDIIEGMPNAQVIGADYILGPLLKLAANHPEWPLLQFDLTQSPLPSACLDAAVLLNVFEHIPDDALAAQHVFRMLRPGGVAVIEVPAGPDLFDVYDKQLMHFRRYTSESLAALLRGAGFEVLDSSHIGFFLYPAFAFVKRRNQKHLNASAEQQRQIVAKSMNMAKNNSLMNLLMAAEGALSAAIPYPKGIRCVAVGRKSA